MQKLKYSEIIDKKLLPIVEDVMIIIKNREGHTNNPYYEEVCNIVHEYNGNMTRIVDFLDRWREEFGTR